jgi:DNA primase
MSGVYDHAAISRVQQANDIVEIVSEHVSLKKKGRELVGLCPFHEDHRPSMYVNPAKQIYKCFACGAGGDVLKFVQAREGLTFPQAVERLAERAGIALRPVRRTAPQTPEQSQDVDPNLLARVNAWAAQFFQRCLNDPEKGKHARDYLAERKITPESIKKWRLGLAPNAVDALARAAAAQKVPAQALQQAGLVAGPNQDKFVNRLMFPITDVTGRVIGFGGRTLSEAGAKYINSPTTALFDKSSTLYGLEQARHQIVATGTAVVVEGYTDVIMPHQVGYANVVATLGTSLTAGHGRILRRYAKKMVLVFDSDTAGMAAANRALEVCLSLHLDIKLAFVPQGKDPCDFVLTAGKEEFERVVEQATDVLQYKWDRLREMFAADGTLGSRKAALDEFLQALAAGLASNSLPVIESGLVINKVARILGLREAEIRSELGRRVRQSSGLRPERTENEGALHPVDWGQGLYAAAQREVLEVLLNEPGLAHSIERRITQDMFDVPVLSRIASILLDIIQSDDDFSISRVLARTESVELAECIMELQRVGEEKGNYRSRLVDSLEVLSRRWRQMADVPTRTVMSQGDARSNDVKPSDRQHPHSIGMV